MSFMTNSERSKVLAKGKNPVRLSDPPDRGQGDLVFAGFQRRSTPIVIVDDRIDAYTIVL